VSDVVTLARTARESLARGLSALQGDPNVPPHLVELAEPIAQAMGALHQIERSGGPPSVSSAQAALTNLQQALAQLQSQPARHPVVVTATEAVAGALGSVHALARAASGNAAAPAPNPPIQAPVAAPPRPAPVAPQPVAQPPIVRPVPGVAPPVPPPRTQQQPQVRAAQPTAAAPSPARGPDLQPVIAELGTHSPSNFYKGLSGNDIIDHGGLFVSTYKLPKLGTTVRLKVSLPGGYEFEANALVRWRREANDGGSDAPPGFGAQFTEIAPEARQLVYRYVRNREPMFHDDL
jgi:uncharacterized protein (TIGR02266 family)